MFFGKIKYYSINILNLDRLSYTEENTFCYFLYFYTSFIFVIFHHIIHKNDTLEPHAHCSLRILITRARNYMYSKRTKYARIYAMIYR